MGTCDRGKGSLSAALIQIKGLQICLENRIGGDGFLKVMTQHGKKY